MKQFTFKKWPKARGLTGVAKAGRENYDIKLNGVKVGSFGKDHFHDPIIIRFMIVKDDIMEDGNPNCVWMWKQLKYKPTSIDEAKSFLKTLSKIIQEKYNLYVAEN